MDVTIKEFRQETTRKKRGVRRGLSGYPERMRRFVVSFAAKAISGGETVSRTVRELGVSEGTLSKWMTDVDNDDMRGVGFREVVVEGATTRPDSPPGSIRPNARASTTQAPRSAPIGTT